MPPGSCRPSTPSDTTPFNQVKRWRGRVVWVKDGTGADVTTNLMHLGNINPFRYRGYYYDVESKLYYLQSRYYDPETGRF